MKLKAYICALHAALFAILLAVSPAGSTSVSLTGAGKASSGGSGFSLTYGGKIASTTGGTTVSYTSIPHSATNTRVIASIVWYPGGAISGVVCNPSCGGVTFSQIASAYATVGTTAVDQWISSGPIASTTTSLDVTYATSPTYHTAVALYDLVSTGSLVAADVRTGTTPFGTSIAVSPALTVPGGGSALVVAMTQNAAVITASGFTADDTYTAGGTYFVWGRTTSSGSPGGTFSSDTAVISAAAWGP